MTAVTAKNKQAVQLPLSEGEAFGVAGNVLPFQVPPGEFLNKYVAFTGNPGRVLAAGEDLAKVKEVAEKSRKSFSIAFITRDSLRYEPHVIAAEDRQKSMDRGLMSNWFGRQQKQ